MVKRLRRRGRLAPSPAVLSAACLVALLALGAIFVFGGESDTDVSARTLAKLDIDVPETMSVGESVSIVVRGAEPGELVTLLIDAGYGPERHETLALDGSATFEIAPSDAPGTGTVTVSAIADSGRGDGSYELLPGEPVDSVDSYIGPRTVVADGEDFSMIVAVPVDRLGNPVANGTTVTFSITREEASTLAQREKVVRSTSGLLAYAKIVAGTVAGRTTVGVDALGAGGAERSFLEVADTPVDVSINTTGAIPKADGASLFEIETSVLADQYGNVVPDGTMVLLQAEGATGSRRLSGFSIDGVARFFVEAPNLPGSASFHAFVGDVASSSLVVSFETGVSDLPVEVVPAGDELTIVIGRVVGPDGSYVPDGTIATVVAGATVVEVELELGTGSVDVAATAASVEVSVLGTSATSISDGR